jgi:hypothetical protein
MRHKTKHYKKSEFGFNLKKHLVGLVIGCIGLMGLVFLLMEIKNQQALSSKAATISDLVVYTDSLNGGWEDYSWGGSRNFSYSLDKYEGTSSIAFTPRKFGGLYLHLQSVLDTTPYDSVHFAAKTSAVNQKYSIVFYRRDNRRLGRPVLLTSVGGQPTNDSWKVYNIPLKTVTADARNIKGFAIEDESGNPRGSIYIDEVRFNAASIVPTPVPTVVPIIVPTPLPTSISTPKPTPIITPRPTINPTATPNPVITPVPTAIPTPVVTPMRHQSVVQILNGRERDHPVMG